MKNRKNYVGITVRLLSTLFAALFVISGLFSAAFLEVTAASSTVTETGDETSVSNIAFRDRTNNRKVGYLNSGVYYNLSFSYVITDTVEFDRLKAVSGKAISFSVPANSGWDDGMANATATITTKGDSTVSAAERSLSADVLISGLRASKQNSLLNLAFLSGGVELSNISFFVPDSYFTVAKSSSTSDPDTPPASKTILENYIVTDSKGNRLTEINEDTEPFKLVVTYLEYGLEEFDVENIPDNSMSVYIEDMGGFASTKGTRGVLEALTPNSDKIPRFKASFSGLTFDGKGTNALALKMLYDIDGKKTPGEVKVTISQAKVKDEDEKDKNKIAPVKPYIIIGDYSYGDADVEAGTNFTLSFNYTNTSTVTGLESIVMTIVPPEDLSIASSSSMTYTNALAPQGTLSHKIELFAKPTAKVGNAEIKVTFSYQYVDTVNKTRESVEVSTTIGVPIIQLDRFSMDTITELPGYCIVGEPFYITSSFINRGNSPTRNISAKVESKSDFVSAGEHFGNLEAGKTNSVEVGITASEPGDFVGEIVIMYEDENSKQKELRQPFSVYVEEPYNPGLEENPFPNGEEGEESGSVGTLTIVCIVIGCLFIAAPIVFYFIKRKTNASEVLDEDF